MTETAVRDVVGEAPPTVLPARAAADRERIRRPLGVIRPDDVGALVGSAFAGVSATAVIFLWLTPASGALAFVVVSYLLFLTVYAFVVASSEPGPIVRDKVAAVAIHAAAALVLCVLIFVIIFTVFRGRKALEHLNFFTQDLRYASAQQPLSVGGMSHAVVGTLEQITIALCLVVPLGISCAVFLNEVPGRFSRTVRTIVEAMTALPSIVCGLFIYAALILGLGHVHTLGLDHLSALQKCGFAAALAVSVEMLPLIIRASDVVLRLVPGSLKEASYALGAGQFRTVMTVTLPTARSGLMTAVILGTARGIGETSPVLLTAGYTAVLNKNPFSGPQVNMPLAAFELIRSGQPNQVARGFAIAAALLLLVLVLFAVARLIGGRPAGQLTKRGQRRRAAQSARDLARWQERSRPASSQSLLDELTGGHVSLLPEPRPL